jgi:FlaA1/EpsC-like NDP-sugar epimerase
MGLFIIRTVGKFNRRKASIGGIIFFMFYSFLIFLFIYRGDVGKIVWSWILYMINLSPIFLFASISFYLETKPISIERILIMIFSFTICSYTFFQLTILTVGGYESWMSGVFTLYVAISCIWLLKFTYRWWKNSKQSSNESD